MAKKFKSSSSTSGIGMSSGMNAPMKPMKEMMKMPKSMKSEMDRHAQAMMKMMPKIKHK